MTVDADPGDASLDDLLEPVGPRHNRRRGPAFELRGDDVVDVHGRLPRPPPLGVGVVVGRERATGRMLSRSPLAPGGHMSNGGAPLPVEPAGVLEEDIAGPTVWRPDREGPAMTMSNSVRPLPRFPTTRPSHCLRLRLGTTGATAERRRRRLRGVPDQLDLDGGPWLAIDQQLGRTAVADRYEPFVPDPRPEPMTTAASTTVLCDLLRWARRRTPSCANS